MTIVTLSVTFFTQLNKNIQSYGTITLQYGYYQKNLINWKNKLSFKINQNLEKELMTLQLEDLLSPRKIETEDSKVTNISILSVAEFKMQIKDESITEGLQKFDQYTQLNPISI